MGWGVKIGGSRGPKCRLELLLGPFLVILSHFGPFWAFFGHLGGGKGSKWVRTPYGWGKMERGVKIGGSRGPKWRLDPPPFGAISRHFEPF